MVRNNLFETSEIRDLIKAYARKVAIFIITQMPIFNSDIHNMEGEGKFDDVRYFFYLY